MCRRRPPRHRNGVVERHQLVTETGIDQGILHAEALHQLGGRRRKVGVRHFVKERTTILEGARSRVKVVSREGLGQTVADIEDGGIKRGHNVGGHVRKGLKEEQGRERCLLRLRLRGQSLELGELVAKRFLAARKAGFPAVDLRLELADASICSLFALFDAA